MRVEYTLAAIFHSVPNGIDLLLLICAFSRITLPSSRLSTCYKFSHVLTIILEQKVKYFHSVYHLSKSKVFELKQVIELGNKAKGEHKR